MPCTRSWPLYSGLRAAGTGLPSLITPSNWLLNGSMTEPVLEVWSAAYTRSAFETGMSGRPNGACICPNACGANAPGSRHKIGNKRRTFITAPCSLEKRIAVITRLRFDGRGADAGKWDAWLQLFQNT